MFRIRSEGLAGQEVKCVQLNKSGHTEVQKEGGRGWRESIGRPPIHPPVGGVIITVPRRLTTEGEEWVGNVDDYE